MALSDAEIERLLSEAETRLAAKASASSKAVSKLSAPAPVPHDTGSLAIKPQTDLRRPTLGVRTVEAAAKKNKTRDNAGPNWFNMPKTDLTPELKKDLQLLRMRSVLNPGQFFKKESRKDPVPEYSQVGTIISGPTDPASSRLTRRQRKRTIVEEVLGSDDVMAKFRNRYGKVQDRKTSGRKGHYKRVVAQRRKGR